MNQFEVGDIICYNDALVNSSGTYTYMITRVEPKLISVYCTYYLLQLTTGKEDTISFDNAHRNYRKVA